MPFKILFTPGAQKDIQEAFDYYSDINPEIGQRFLGVLDERLQKLTITPLAGSLRYEDVRCTLLKKFPYIIHYTVHENDLKIIVQRVLHTSQKPLWEESPPE